MSIIVRLVAMIQIYREKEELKIWKSQAVLWPWLRKFPVLTEILALMIFLSSPYGDLPGQLLLFVSVYIL